MHIVSGLVLEDIDNNDSRDSPLSGIVVADVVLVGSTVTDSAGMFTFDLRSSRWSVMEIGRHY